MKTSTLLLLAALALGSAGTMRAFGFGKAPAQVEVVFFEPKNFTDVRDSYQGDSEKARDATLADLRDYLIKNARKYLAPGQKLTVTVTNVDLAGEFEPWRGAQFDSVRIVRDIYPPCIDLTFRLTDADGQVIKQGKRELRDSAFLMKITMAFHDDPLRHEKALLDDWVSDELGGLKKG